MEDYSLRKKIQDHPVQMRKPQVRAPLLWQYWPIFALAGILASFYPLPGATFALVLLFLEKRLHNGVRVLLAVLIFFGMYLVTPLFLSGPATDAGSWTARTPGKKTTRFCALVESSRGLTDGRLQIVLSGLSPQNGDTKLPGKAIWTWDVEKSSPRPLPGQNVCLTRPIQPIHDFRNESISLREIKARSQNILWRVWSRSDIGEPQISGEADFFARLRWELETKLIDLAGLAKEENAAKNRAFALIPALLFGDRFFIPQEMAEKFSKAAIGHSLALSGQHLAIAALFSYLVILVLARLWSRLYLWRPKIILMSLGSCPFALAYLWLGAAPSSLLRAACMLFIFCAIFVFYKNFTGLDVLLLAFCILFCLNPYGIMDTGLQFSFLCVLILTLIVPALFVNNNHKSQSARFLGILFKIFFVSLVLQIFLLPLTLKTFGTVGLWFPINVFWLPLLGFIVLPFSFITLLLLALPFDCAHGLAGYCLEIAGIPVSWLLDILDWLHSGQFLSEPVFLRPHWTALFAYAMIFAAFAFLAKLWKQNCRERKELNPVRFSRHSLYALIFSKKRHSPSSALAVSSPRGRNEAAAITFLCLGLVFLAIGPLLRLERYFASDPMLEVLDVGQGQAIVLHFGRHGKILVDGGGMSSERFEPGKAILTPILTDNHAPYLTAIINSHPDLDHLGGLIYPIEHLSFQKQFHNGYAAKGALHDKWESLKNKPNSFVLRAGDTVRVAGSGYSLEALAPVSDTYPLSANNASLVLRLTDGKKGLALIPGDAEKGSIKKLLDSEKDLSAQILIAPHHGSNNSFSAKFLEKVNPELVVAACGFRNRYFYPGRKLREWTRKNGVKLLDTGESGRLGIRWDKNGKFRVDQVFRE